MTGGKSWWSKLRGIGKKREPVNREVRIERERARVRGRDRQRKRERD